MPENEVVASFLYLQKLWNTRLYMNLRMTEKVCCFENVCHVWLWNSPSETGLFSNCCPSKCSTTSLEFYHLPGVLAQSSHQNLRRSGDSSRFNLDGAIWGGAIFLGEDGHVFKRNDEQDEQLVWGDSHQQVLNDQLFEVCHIDSLKFATDRFFLSKENLKNWFGFSLFGFVCNSMCSSFPGTL